MRQKELRGAEAVIAQLVDAAAAEEQKAAHQRARMMHAAGGRPAVGAAEDRLCAMLLPHPRELLRHERQRFIP